MLLRSASECEPPPQEPASARMDWPYRESRIICCKGDSVLEAAV